MTNLAVKAMRDVYTELQTDDMEFSYAVGTGTLTLKNSGGTLKFCAIDEEGGATYNAFRNGHLEFESFAQTSAQLVHEAWTFFARYRQLLDAE